jgi:uncharacterized DUF497 family protein
VLFEWDQAKSDRNLRERGFGFDAAALIFEGPVIEWCDIRETWGEIRIVAIGIAVVYTERGEVRRIISARKARRKERALWRLFENP